MQFRPQKTDNEHNASGLQNASRPNAPPLLLIWLSPSFPVGAFAYSHGLETAIEQALVRDNKTLQAWLDDLVRHGSLRNDMILLSLAWKSVARADGHAFSEINDLAIALQPSAERKLETVTQGNAFVQTVSAAWPCESIGSFADTGQDDIAYPVAVALASAGHGIALRDALIGFGIAFAGNLISAAIRLGIIGQTDGQRVQATLLPLIEASACAYENASLTDLGSVSWVSDLCAMKHETQRTRLFRS